MFAPDGTEQPSLIDGRCDFMHAASCGQNGELLAVCGYAGLAVIDLESSSVRWASVSATSDGGCIATLPRRGAIFTTVKERIQAVDVYTGNSIGSITGDSIFRYAVGDDESDTIFFGKGPLPCSVSAFCWGAEASGGATYGFTALGAIESAGAPSNCRPMAIVRPPPGLRTSYLVLGVIWAPTLLVLALPSFTLVHTHKLAGVQVTGLAADPRGAALVVVDKAILGCHTLPWPLPGMPPLE